MNRQRSHTWGPLEYILIVVLVFLVLFTLASLFWPAIELFYQSTLSITPTAPITP